MRTYRYLLIAIAALCVALMVHAAGSLHVAAGTWVNGPAMSTERTSAATVLMPDGRLLITGGRDANGNALTSAEFINSDGSISEAPSMAIARSGHRAVWLPTGYVLVAGGTTSGGGVTNTAELFDPLANNWVTLPSTLVEARTDFTATVLRFGNVVIAGGTHAGAPVSTVEVFDVSQETFSSVGALSVARANAAAAAISDWKVLVTGGSDVNGSTLASTEIIDTEAGTITAGPALGEARKSASATVLLDGRVLIAGGSHPEAAEANGSVAELATTEIFDAAAGTISAGPALSSARSEHQAFLLPNNNGVLLVGGVSAGQDLASADLYTPATGSFTAQANMSAARKQGTGSAMYGTAFRYGTDGVLLLAGGSNQNSSEFYGFATVETDKDDYAPGTPVIITGSGWVPGETVRLSLLESPNLDTHTLTPVVADANGNIYSSEFAPDASDIGLKFYVTAIGSKSMAQNVFKDAVTVTLTPSSGAVGTLVSLTTGGGGFAGGASASVFFDPISTAVANCTANNGGNIVSGCTFTVPTTTTGGHTVTIKNSTDSYTGSFTITGKATPTVTTWPSASAITYGDSLALSTLSGGVASVPGNFAFTTPSTKPSSGTYSAAVTFTPTDTSSYNTVSGSVNVIVNKAVLTITADDKSMVFGGAVPALTYTPAGFKNSETSAVLTGSPTLSTTATTSSPVGNYPITAAVGTLAATNYSFTFVNGNLAVGKADVTVAWSNTTATYDGSSHAITATPTPSAAALTITYTGTDNGGSNYNSTTPPTNAGSYTATATLSDTTNYKFAAAAQTTSSFTISKADPTVTATGGNFTYDTTAKTGSGSATGVGSVSLTPAVTLSYEDSAQNAIASAPVNAGSYFVVAHFAGNSNYNLKDSTPAAITILKATPVVHVANVTATYDGDAHPATGTVTGVSNADLGAATITYSPGGTTDPVNAGSYAVVASYAGSDNYNAASASATVEIAKANSTTAVTFEAGSYVYRATAFTATALATGAGNLSQSVTVSYSGDCVNVSVANGCTAAATFAGDTNHTGSSDSKSITILKANADVQVSGYTGTYDAVAHGATGTAAGVGGVDLSSGLSLGEKFTDVPGGTAHWTFNGGTNYNGTSGVAEIVISKANAQITVNGYTGVYDAAAHGASGSATGVGGVNLSSGLSLGATFTDVPGGTAHWTFTGGTNYNDDSGDAAIDISKADAVVSVSGYTGTYDGNPHGATGTAKGVGGVDLPGLTLGSSFTDVPGGTAHWVFTGGTNYKDQSGDVAVTISKADATINVTGYSGNYDGSAHGASGTATGVGGADLSGGLSLGSTFTNVPGGTAHWTFVGGTNYNDRAGYVAIDISKADPLINVTGYTGVYDGNAHGATGSATGAKNEPLAGLDLGASFTNVPGGTADWTFTDSTGNYNNKSGSVAVTISKADATINVTGFAGVYDGNAHGASGTAKGVKGESLSGLLITGSFTDVPGGTANWTFTDSTGNYNNASGTAPIVINKADATINVSGYTGTYDGNSHGATGTAKGVKNEALGGLVITGMFTNVPGGTANWVFTDVTGNYNNNSGTAAIVITKATATVSVTGYNVIFDNVAHTATGSAKGVQGETLSGLNLSGTTHTIVGNYTDPWSFTDVTGNYNGASGTVNDSIGAWTLSGFYQPVTTYTGGIIVWNTVKGGSTVPVKFNIYAGSTQRTDVAAANNSIAVYPVNCTTNGYDDSIDYVTNTGNTMLRYDSTGGQFIQNWQTPKGANLCYLVRMTALDGSKLDAYFKTK